MIRIIKHLCKYWYSVLIVIALLFAQAACDLSLPEYTSRIVNTGIQEGGIEDNVPEAMSVDTFNHALLFLEEEDARVVEDHYQLITSEDATEEQLDTYPELKKEAIYLLEDIDQDTRDELNQILQKPFTYLLLFSGDSESGKEIEQQMMENLPEEMRQIPDLTMMDVLEMMPEESRQEMTKEMDQAMEDMPDTLYEQSAVQFKR